MRLLLSAILAGGSLVFAIAAVAQSTTSSPAASVNPAPAEPVASGKRFACQSASQAFKGQEQKDQMQLCMAQARLDCLKQAIDQKIVGPPRRDFVKNCVQDLPE
jgi:Spy/CpxP family protein refolding chaperone